MYGHLKRKRTIRNLWFFNCACSRCQDPCENNSFLSAVKCPECKNGYVLPINPMDIDLEWHCSSCGHKQSPESIQENVDGCFNKIFEVNDGDVETYEELLKDFLQRLHPNHFIGK